MNTSPTIRSAPDVVRACYTAYEKKDRALLESLLSPDFTFSSPIDDNISREAYFCRCWPNSEHAGTFDIEKLLVDGNEVVVQYTAQPLGHESSFRNVEVFRLRDGLVTHVSVYFGSETAGAASEEEVQGVIKAWAEAIRRKDMEGVVKQFADESVRFNLAPPLQSITESGQDLLEWFATWEGEIGYEIRDLKIHVSGDVAMAHSLNHMTGEKNNGEPPVDLWFRETLGLRKINGRWRIVHEHESVPFKMDGSFQAAVDLKP